MRVLCGNDIQWLCTHLSFSQWDNCFYSRISVLSPFCILQTWFPSAPQAKSHFEHTLATSLFSASWRNPLKPPPPWTVCFHTVLGLWSRAPFCFHKYSHALDMQSFIWFYFKFSCSFINFVLSFPSSLMCFQLYQFSTGRFLSFSFLPVPQAIIISQIQDLKSSCNTPPWWILFKSKLLKRRYNFWMLHLWVSQF